MPSPLARPPRLAPAEAAALPGAVAGSGLVPRGDRAGIGRAPRGDTRRGLRAAGAGSERAGARRGGRGGHGRLLAYHRLIAAVVLANVAVLAAAIAGGDWRIADGSALTASSALTLVNLAAPVVDPPADRAQRHLRPRRPRLADLAAVDPLERLEGAPRRRHPRRLRDRRHGLAVRLRRRGDRHPRPRSPRSSRRPRSRCAGASSCVLARGDRVCAAPPSAARAHDVFELTHRWGGWTRSRCSGRSRSQLAVDGRGDTTPPTRSRRTGTSGCSRSLTACVVWPWLRLRRVPITVDRPSSHVAIVSSTTACARAYVVGRRHQPQPAARVARVRRRHDARSPRLPPAHLPRRRLDRPVHRRSADATSGCAACPSRRRWRRSALYERVVYVVTGSGIGPCLGQILANRVPSRLVWSTRDPAAHVRRRARRRGGGASPTP